MFSRFNRKNITMVYGLIADTHGLQDVSERLERIGHPPDPELTYDSLSDSGKALYRHHTAALETGNSPIRSNLKPTPEDMEQYFERLESLPASGE